MSYNPGRDDELAAPGLLMSRRERALPEKIELVFVEAALQPQQQAIIAAASRWSPDRSATCRPRGTSRRAAASRGCCAQTARLPVRPPRRLCPDNLGDHALEPRPRGPAGRGRIFAVRSGAIHPSGPAVRPDARRRGWPGPSGSRQGPGPVIPDCRQSGPGCGPCAGPPWCVRR